MPHGNRGGVSVTAWPLAGSFHTYCTLGLAQREIWRGSWENTAPFLQSPVSQHRRPASGQRARFDAFYRGWSFWVKCNWNQATYRDKRFCNDSWSVEDFFQTLVGLIRRREMLCEPFLPTPKPKTRGRVRGSVLQRRPLNRSAVLDLKNWTNKGVELLRGLLKKRVNIWSNFKNHFWWDKYCSICNI